MLFAILQFFATVAVRDDSGGWVRFVPATLARRIDDTISAYPLPPNLRLVLARDALARGDFAAAKRDADRLRASSDRSALLAGLARANGDIASASRADLAAGDLTGVEADARALVARGRYRDATALERALVERLDGQRTQADVLARALFALGGMQETLAYRSWVASKARIRNERLSLEAFERAANLAPLTTSYLLATANQALNVGAYDAPANDIAAQYFARAERLDPRSPEPVVGLGEVAFRRGDISLARRELARARVLDANDPGVARFAATLARSMR